MTQPSSELPWHVNRFTPRLSWQKHAVRPAEIGNWLCRVITASENILEDAEYNKVVPNHFKIELTGEDYRAYFAPLEAALLHQWQDRLLEHLGTTNARLGREEFRLAGQLRLELCAASDLRANQARILCCVEPAMAFGGYRLTQGPKVARAEIAYLELVSGNRRWPLYPGENTIGRDPTCDIYLNLPLVQEKRIISAQHARIRIEAGNSVLFDGGLSGKPSANGTFVNSRPVPAHGVALKEGDVIILAAMNPLRPRPDAPGVAALRFCRVRLEAGQR